jgi:hypothetical protein
MIDGVEPLPERLDAPPAAPAKCWLHGRVAQRESTPFARVGHSPIAVAPTNFLKQLVAVQGTKPPLVARKIRRTSYT